MAIPLIGAGLSLLGGILGNRSANKAAKDQARLNNQYIAQQNAARQSILEGLKAKGYDPFGPQTTTRQGGSSGTSSMRGTSRTRGTTKTTRTVNAENQAAENMLRGRIEGRLANKAGVSQGEILNQIANINRGSAAAQRAIANKVAGRGLSGAQAAGAYTPAEMGRTAEINNFLASIPTLARQRQAEDEAAASGFLAERAGTQQDVDQTTDTSQFGTTSSSDWGSATGGPDIGALTTLFMPTGGPQQSTQTGQSSLAGALSGIGSGLAQWGASRQPKTGGVAMPNLTPKWNPATGKYELAG